MNTKPYLRALSAFAVGLAAITTSTFATPQTTYATVTASPIAIACEGYAQALSKVGMTYNNAEKAECVKDPLTAVEVSRFALQATNMTIALYGSGYQDGSRANAFKHCMWSGLMAAHLGTDKAEKWATLHEPSRFQNWVLDPNTSMDLFNNMKGREFATKVLTFTDNGTKAQIAEKKCAEGAKNAMLVKNMTPSPVGNKLVYIK